MAVLRFLTALFLLVAVVTLVADLTPRLAGTGHPPLTTIDRLWTGFAPASLQTAKAFVGRVSSPLVWTLLSAAVLNVPLVALSAVLALLAGWGGARRRRVDVYTN